MADATNGQESMKTPVGVGGGLLTGARDGTNQTEVRHHRERVVD
jgi:hypothetical protein